jgi:hypothetical protein
MKEDETGGACSMHGDMRNVYKILIGKTDRKRPRNKGKDNIRMDTEEGVNWVHVAQDRDQWRALVNMVMNLQVP